MGLSCGLSRLLCGLGLLFSCACGPLSQSQWLAKYARDIVNATQSIETARNDGERARGYAERGRGYSETARYSRSFKLIDASEYGRLFGLAMSDHDRAVEFAPADAQVFLSRGLTRYDRAALEDRAAPETKALLSSAEADFTRAIENEPRSARALDMRGLVRTMSGDLDGAVADFTRELAIDSRRGRLRLAEAHCTRGSSHQQAKRYDLAIADYEMAIELGIPRDGCDCQPESPLAWIYFERRQYDKCWEVVRAARESKRWIAPELVEQLQKASGRNQ